MALGSWYQPGPGRLGDDFWSYGAGQDWFFLGQYEIESVHECENAGIYLPPF
jgi:hypothetical protein